MIGSRQGMAQRTGQPKHGGRPLSGNRVGRFTGMTAALNSHEKNSVQRLLQRRKKESAGTAH